MPIDASIPLQVQAPNGMNTLGQVMGVANQAQTFASNNLALQKASQANQERLALQQFTSNPDNWMTNGQIDLDKINKVVPTIAPLTGPDYIGKMTTMQQAQTEASQARTNLTQNQRGVIAGTLGVLGRSGVTDPAVVSKALDDLGAQFPDDKNFGTLVSATKTQLGMIPAGPHISQALVSASQSLLSPSEQQGALSPTVGLTNTGKNLQETITQPSVSGNAPSISMTGRAAPLSMPPGSNVHLIQINGKTYQATQDPTTGGFSNIVPAENAGNGPPLNNPDEQQRQQLGAMQGEVNLTRSAADQAGVTHNINQRILQLSNNTATGPGTQTWKAVLGAAAAPLGVNAPNVESYQELGKYLEKNAIAAMGQMGGNPSDARLAAASAANGSPQFNPGALREVTKFNDAATSALEMYRAGMDKAVGLKNEDYSAMPGFKSAWAKNMDINIFRIQNAIQNGDTEELQKIKQNLGTTPDGKYSEVVAQQKMQALAQKRLALQTLSQTGRLPQ